MEVKIKSKEGLLDATIKKSFGKAFKNHLELFDKDTPKEEIAAMFFELGWKARVENLNSCMSAATKVLGEMSRKRDRHHELTTQLWGLLTKEETERGYVYVTYEVDVATLVHTNSDMVDKVLKKSKYRDHIIGFKRVNGSISISLDEEGQKLWDEDNRKIAEFYAKY